MKRKFEETYATSYSEARSLVFNISIGKLQMSSPKPVEPSLWRSLLIVKTLHRIAEELHREAAFASEVLVEEKSVESTFDDNQLETLFCLQNAPVAVFLSEDDRTDSDYPDEQLSDSGKDSGMAIDETNEATSSSLIMLSTYLPSNSSVGLLSHQSVLDSTSHGKVETGLAKTLAGLSGEHDNFADIDCSCLESFPSTDLSDISMSSIDREFLHGVQSASCFSVFGSQFGDYHGGSGGIADLDSLMHTLEN